MKALICTKPGSLEYIQLEEPGTSRTADAIVKIKRVGICGTDIHAVEGTQPYFNYPRILGHELSAEVVEVDPVHGFRIGERVTILPYLNCESCGACLSGRTNCCVNLKVLGVHVDGGMVEYLSVPVRLLVHSKELNLDQLALVEPISIGAHAVARAKLQSGDFALVVGAGPIGVGTAAIAATAGAQVILMDVNSDRLNYAGEVLPLMQTINAQDENIVEQLRDITDGTMPGVVFDATGNLAAIENSFNYIAHGGSYVLVGLQKQNISFSHPEFHKREATLMSSRNATRSDFEFVIDSIASGRLDPERFVTRRINFNEAAVKFKEVMNPASGVIKALIEL